MEQKNILSDNIIPELKGLIGTGGGGPVEATANLRVATDTPAGWSTALGGPGYYLQSYTRGYRFTTQPSIIGTLETFIFSDGKIIQKWYAEDDVCMVYRTGTSSGWWSTTSTTGQWRSPISRFPYVGVIDWTLDSSNKVTNITVPVPYTTNGTEFTFYFEGHETSPGVLFPNSTTMASGATLTIGYNGPKKRIYVSNPKAAKGFELPTTAKLGDYGVYRAVLFSNGDESGVILLNVAN